MQNNINKEVLEVQTNLKNYFSKLKFDEKSHSYTVEDKKLTSVSHFIHKYKNRFDAQAVAPFSAKKLGLSTEEVLQMWEDNKNRACELGTKVHLFGENYVLNNFTGDPTDGYEQAIVNFWKILPEHIIPVTLELQMYNEDFRIAGTADIICYNTKTKKLQILDYKGLPLDTPILTTKGFKNMGDLTLEDKVFDKDGKECNIKAISKIHNKKCLKIIFDNKESIISDFEHRWLVNINNKDVVMTTQEIMDWNNKHKNKRSHYNILKVPVNKSLQTQHINLPIDPYVLGVWLGDGHKSCGMITQANPLVWNEIEKRGYKLGEDVSQGSTGLAQSRTIFGLSKELKKLNLLYNKNIPDIYLLASFEQRKDLLRGFMDADGYYNKKRKRFVITTTKKDQIIFAKKLLSSLGIKSTVVKCNKYCNNKIIQGYNLCFTLKNFNPFLCRNQDIDLTNIKNSYSKYKNIKDVIEIESVPTRCIEVDSESHTFLCTHNLTVTHNTNKDLFKNYNEQKLHAPFDRYLDNGLNGYKLQLSMYQILLEQTGYEVENRVIIWIKPDGSYSCYRVENLTKELLEELSKRK